MRIPERWQGRIDELRFVMRQTSKQIPVDREETLDAFVSIYKFVMSHEVHAHCHRHRKSSRQMRQRTARGAVQ